MTGPGPKVSKWTLLLSFKACNYDFRLATTMTQRVSIFLSIEEPDGNTWRHLVDFTGPFGGQRNLTLEQLGPGVPGSWSPHAEIEQPPRPHGEKALMHCLMVTCAV